MRSFLVAAIAVVAILGCGCPTAQLDDPGADRTTAAEARATCSDEGVSDGEIDVLFSTIRLIQVNGTSYDNARTAWLSTNSTNDVSVCGLAVIDYTYLR